MDTFLVTSTLLLTALSLFLGYKWYKIRLFKSANCRMAESVFRHVDAYVVIVNNLFNVQRTNYYMRNNRQEPGEMPKLGNLLHCKNGTDAGVCGTHAMCTLCTIRGTVQRAFDEHRNFSKLEAVLIVYASEGSDQTVECHVAITGNYIPATKDRPEEMLLSIHDITSLKSIQVELNKALIRAEESDRMKSLFLANTSHELRTPLNAILGFSELLAEECSPEEKYEYVRIIRSSNQILLQLINDILDMSKIEAGTLEFTYTDVELNPLMEELEGVFRMKQEEGSPVHIQFERKYSCCVIRTDRERFTQVVSNFLSNALKFTTQGEIAFGFEIRAGELYIYVRDTGKGIPADQLSLVFQRFVKIGSHKQGVGIGLAICKSIIDTMHGQIGVESEEGKGSTFWFSLPCEPRN